MGHDIVDGVKIPFSPERQAEFDANKIAKAPNVLLQEWVRLMRVTDDGIPRYLEDHIKDDHDGVASNKFLQTKYDKKVALRATKP